MMILATSTGGTMLITVVAFLILLLILVALLLFTKEKLSPSGPVTLTINGEKKIEVASGSTLLSTLGNQKVFLPSACGGGGTCIPVSYTHLRAHETVLDLVCRLLL